MEIKPFSYASGAVPEGYQCGTCGTTGVRLYRLYQTFLNQQELFCRACALKDQEKEAPDQPKEHSIGWLVAAVPTEDGATFWGYTSVPQAGVIWWDRLPKERSDA